MPPQSVDDPESPVSPTASKVAVIGATGRLGRRAVQKLLEKGIHCKLLLRDSETEGVAVRASLEDCLTAAEVGVFWRSFPRDQVTIVEGGPNGVSGNLPSLIALVMDCDACLALWGSTRRSTLGDWWKPRKDVEAQPLHAKQVNYRGVQSLLRACRLSGGRCKRIVRVTGNVEDPEGFFSILVNLFGSMATAWNYEGEQALRAQTAVEYTIVRPGIMVEDVPTAAKDPREERLLPRDRLLQLADDGGNLPVTTIRYEDVASLCVEVLDYANAAGCTLTARDATPTEAKEDESPAANWQSSWAPLLQEVQPDRRTFPSDMLDRHYAAVAATQCKLAVLGASLLGTILLGYLMKSFGCP